jgi:hypothetical protein
VTPGKTERALLWANEIPDDAMRHKASSTLVEAMSDWPMAEAVRLSLRIEDAEARTEGVERPLRRGAIADESSAECAGKTFRGLPPERQDPDIAGRLATCALAHSGLQAGRAFLDQLPEGPARDEASERFVALAAQNNQQAEAAAYATRLPLESGATRMDFFVAGWAKRDAGAAQEWVRSLPAGPHREKAEEGLAFAAQHDTRGK